MENYSSEFTSAMVTSYLLGTLPEAEQERLEEQYFSDDDFFDWLLNLEDQLIHDYLNGQLSAIDRQHFEGRFLTLPARQRKVELARQLQQAARERQEIHRPRPEQKPSFLAGLLNWLRPDPVTGLAAALAMLLIGLIGWQFFNNRNARSPVVTLPSPQAAQTPLASVPDSGPRIISLALSPGILMSGTAKSSSTAELTRSTELVEARLGVGQESYSGYRAILQSKADRQRAPVQSDLLQAETGKDGTKTVVWKIQVTELPVSDYEIRLSGISQQNTEAPLGTYSFQVRSK